MSHPSTTPRFAAAHAKALAEWAAADPLARAAAAHCSVVATGVEVPFFGSTYLVTHPAGEVTLAGAAEASAPVHVSIGILLLHYLLQAEPVPEARHWLAFRELPEGMFYAQAFAAHAEATLSALVRTEDEATDMRLQAFTEKCVALGGQPLDLGDLSYRFQALPRLAVAVVLWRGDEDEAGEARLLFDAAAPRLLPTEDLSGMGDWLAHKLTRA